jgi:hypothetical protein
MDFDPVCVDDCRTVVCRAQDHGRAATGYARQLGDPWVLPNLSTGTYGRRTNRL